MRRWTMFLIATAFATAIGCADEGDKGDAGRDVPTIFDPGGQDLSQPDKYTPPDTPKEVYDPGPPPIDKGPGDGTFDGGPDTGLPEVFLECVDFTKCLWWCASQECIADCWSRISPQAEQTLEDFFQCLKNRCENECKETGPACDFCMSVAEYDGTCVFDDCFPPPGQELTTCADLIKRVADCPKDNPNTTLLDESGGCVWDQFEKASKQARNDWNAMGLCLLQNCQQQCKYQGGEVCLECKRQQQKSDGACYAQALTCGIHCPSGKCEREMGEDQCNCPEDCGTCAGCCSDGTCLPGTQHTACGASGVKCQDCLATGLACVNQGCVSTLDEGSCKAFYFCIGTCPPQPQGQACIQECQSKLSPQGMQDVQNLQNCLQQYGCFNKPTDEEFAQCLEEFCIVPYFRCFSGVLYQSCSALIDCLVACPEDNPTTPTVNERNECIGNCWTEATFDAQMDLQNVISCANKQCSAQCEDPESAACNTCWNQVLGPGGACESYWDKCAEYGPEGCYYLLTCLNGCPEGDQPCQQACVDQTSKNGLVLYNAIYDCIIQACPVCETNPTSPQCDTCLTAAQQQGGACYDELQTCIADRPYGTKKCGEVFQCVDACLDQKCAQDCFLSGTKTANELFDAMITCALDACPSCTTNPPGADCDTCFDNALQDPAKCKSKYDACMADQAAQ